LNNAYPEAARWTGGKASDQHRGLQVLWLQYDHVIVHSRGGETSMTNIVVTCPACNYGRDRFMMSEVGLRDPRLHPRQPLWNGWREWDGLEGILPKANRYLYSGENNLQHDGAP
ncbi:MAG: HNH endonuclease, partial [Sphingomicrobium sp.]